MSIPPTPPQHTVTLPTSESHTDIPHRETEHLYPLDLCTPIPLARQLELWSIDLLLPAHVHTPSGHIGVIQSAIPNIRISAFEIFVYLSSLATEHQGSDAVELMGTQSESACDCQFPAQPSLTSTAQQSETRDVRDSNIVFGHNEVWGFDVRSEYECSIIHVARAGDDTMTR